MPGSGARHGERRRLEGYKKEWRFHSSFSDLRLCERQIRDDGNGPTDDMMMQVTGRG